MARERSGMLKELHDEHAQALWRYVLHLCGDRSMADDIVQETLLRAWTKWKSLDSSPGGPRAWMYTVARNLVIDDARSARSRYEFGTDEVPERSRDRTDALFDSIVMRDSLAELSADHREVLVHSYYAGRTVPEIARELGIPEGTVKSRLHYGLKALRLALQEKGVTR